MKREGFDSTLFFKPPFGPYPPELRETFPIGQSEIPDWDEDMVVQGCAGLRELMDANPTSRFTVFSPEPWLDILRREIPGCEVQCDRM
jgi:7-cyano-7-deazaguanine tRNA-ribosyltransferase